MVWQGIGVLTGNQDGSTVRSGKFISSVEPLLRPTNLLSITLEALLLLFLLIPPALTRAGAWFPGFASQNALGFRDRKQAYHEIDRRLREITGNDEKNCVSNCPHL
jgi:hypothetical protein